MVGTHWIPVGLRLELKLSKLCQILPKSTKFGRDWAESTEIWLDLEKILADLEEIRPNLDKISSDLN